MKINFSKILTDFDDKPILEGENPVEIKTLLKRAVLADANPDQSAVSPSEKYDRFELFMKLRDADSETEFSAAEVALLDKVVRVYGALIAGQLLRLLKI